MTIQSNKLILLGDGGRVRAAGLVRCVSGQPAGWKAGDSGGRPGSRRGATLILIVGALALISVIILSYFLIGKGDRRTSAVAVRKESIDETIGKVRDWLAVDLIGNDVTSVYVEGENADFNNRYAFVMREAWDYPLTDPQRRSIPSRDPANPAPGTAEFDRIRFDPAGTVPRSFNPVLGPDKNKILVFPGSDPWLASTTPTDLNPGVKEARFDNTPGFDSTLENARDWAKISNIAPDGRYVNLFNLRGRFDSLSGFTGTKGVGDMISDNLTLMNDLGQSNYALGSQKTDYDVTADPNIPFHWDSRQQRAFRPVGTAGLSFADPAFPEYEWADTDGDGFYDARWQELVDATDPNNPVSLLPKDGRFRWFVAARIVDLSGLVNVNVASDTSLNPANPGDPLFGVSNDYRIGMSPSDVDLRSVLTLANPKAVYGLLDKSDGYFPLKQPPGGGPDDYRIYANDIASTTFTPVLVGGTGYNGIAATIGQILTPMGDQDLRLLTPLQAKERYDYYRLSGGFFPSEAGFDEAGAFDNATLTGLFGLPDEIELMTYRGVNDPANRSRLENAVGGRYISDPNGKTPRPEFSPLRDNRSLAVERARDTSQYGQADLAGLMWSALDIRQLLTTVSGARPLRSVRLSYNPANFGDILLAGRMLNANVNELPTDAVAALRSSDNGDPSFLFRGYCDSLLPFSGDLHSWDLTGAFATLAYGYDPLITVRNNPETALRIAAAMTANQTDLYDSDSIPSAYTVLLDGAAGPAIGGDAVNYPWWSVAGPNNTYPGRMDLGSTRLAGSHGPNMEATTQAINVYGIEAQPFVTEVATFQMYTDTPTAKGGDKDWGTPGSPKPVTIDGDILQNNKDFIFQCIAFQLNNPFDDAVDLNGYTIEIGRFSRAPFGGSLPPLNLVGLDPVNGKFNIVLQPHETRTFFILSQPRSEILKRMQVIDPATDVTAVDKWISNQLDIMFAGAGPSAIEVPNSNGVIPLAVKPLMAGTPGEINAVGNREFRLWRTLPGPANPGLLVDRLRDPEAGSRPTLDGRLKVGAPLPVNGTSAPGEGQGDDTGYSITTASYIRRADDPGDPDQGNLVPRRALPAWTLEAKYGNISLNKARRLPQNKSHLLSPDKADFSAVNGDTTFSGLITEEALAVPNGNHLFETIQTNAEDKHGKFNGDPNDGNTIPLNSPANPADPKVAFDKLYAEPHLENDLFKNVDGRSVLRPADMLLALGVGPSQDPMSADDDPNDPFVMGKRDHPGWTTLGESLAMALGYNDPPNDDAHAPFYNLYDKTDRGSLRIDKFVPFMDRNNNYVFDANIDPNLSDQVRGAGIPLALNIFDVFTTLDPQFGSLNRPTVGVLNVNAVPEMAARAETLLSPPADTDLTGYPQWFWPGGPLNSDNTDIVATLLSYRDKTRMLPRVSPPAANDVSFVGPTNVPEIPGYYNTDPNAPVKELYGRGRDPANAANSPTGIDGIRENPGFMTKGELLAVRDLQAVTPGTPTPSPFDMDKLGFDHDPVNKPGQGSINKAGVDSVRYLNNAEDDQIQDDYDEKLAIANGVMNSVSVRSDIFAATFIVHGYQKSDTQGLTDKDPLVPSVARRYLMIVDRSNVVRTGDKPRILVFKELPLK